VAERVYLRDGRAPVPKDERISAVMSRIRAKNTGPELALRKALRKSGLTTYRLHYARVPGRPDVAFVKHKVAVFVHGCFWHGCPHHPEQRVKSHANWWKNKIGTNKARDRRKVLALRRRGWRVITIWECRLKKSPDVQVRKVERAISARRDRPA
jgi:DNA mismatch endonuclease (patch repair protein)